MEQILLVRVGADMSAGGGHWNGPVNPDTHEFVYVAIPESKTVSGQLSRPYADAGLLKRLNQFDAELPRDLMDRHMHLDPDFERCTYGDQGQRAVQLRKLGKGDLIVFYAGLRPTRGAGLVYALIGQLTVERIASAGTIPDRNINAHTRRDPVNPDDIVVFGNRAASGRYERCIPVGEYRDRAYRVTRTLLAEWGGISVRDGYLQRSARLPSLTKPRQFRDWLDTQRIRLLQANN